MVRSFDASCIVPDPGAELRSRAVSFADRLATSESFGKLFKEGMALVEEAAAYLDGRGRVESRQLPRDAALGYATESMRLTTRLMQVASWLLLQRAVNEGDLTPARALSEKHRVRLAHQDLSCGAEIFAALPADLRKLSAHSLRLQARVMHLDRALSAARARDQPPAFSAVADQVERLRVAFAR